MKHMKINRIRVRLAAAITVTALLPTVWAGPLQILNLATNEQVRAVAISPDGTTLAISSYFLEREQPNSGSFQVVSGIELWNVATGRQLNRLHQRPWRQFHGTNTGSYEAGAMEFSPDGKLLAATDGQGFVLWDTTSATEKFRWRSGVADSELSPGWSADGRNALSSSALANLRIWDTESWTTVAVAPGCLGRLWPDGTRVARWRSEKPYVVEIWNLPEFIKTLRGGQSPQEALVQIIEQNRAPMAAATATRNECINNLHQIDLAKRLWAADNGKQSTDTPVWSELLPYFGPNVPQCPSGGTYAVGAVGEKPQCSIAEHRLP